MPKEAEAIWVGTREGVFSKSSADPDDPETIYIVTADGVPPYWGDPKMMQEGFKGGFGYWLAPLKGTRPAGADVMVFQTSNAGETWRPMMYGFLAPYLIWSGRWTLLPAEKCLWERRTAES